MEPLLDLYISFKTYLIEAISSLFIWGDIPAFPTTYAEYIGKYISRILSGTFVTLEQTLFAIVLAVVIAVAFGLMRLSSNFLVRAFATSYIELFRGTSLLVQMFWIFYVLPMFGITLDPYPAGFIAVGLNLGAYGAEVVRGAIQSVPRGQYEAGIALNMSNSLRMRRIIFPQAVVLMMPAWGNLLIELLKGTALVGLISVTDLMFQSRQIYGLSYAAIETFGTVLLVYFVIARFLITPLMRKLERHMSRNLKRN